MSEKLINAYYSAWRLTRAARLEIGAHVLVLGAENDATLSRAVLRLCALHGATLRVLRAAESTEQLAALHADAEKIVAGNAAPGSPYDAVLVLGDAPRWLPAALPLCRNGGAVVWSAAPGAVADLDFYPDAHKRGLRVSGVALEDIKADSGEKHLLERLAARGVLAPLDGVARGE